MTLFDGSKFILWGALFLAPFVWLYVTVRKRQSDDLPWRPEDHDGTGLP
jgi:hypothetical protein